MSKENPASTKAAPCKRRLNTIAANVIESQRQQSEVFELWPQAYVTCLLNKLAERGDVALEDIADEVAALVPEIDDKECERLVTRYMQGERTLA